MKKYNFYAGPSLLPREAVENTAKQILDFNGMGVSLMCVSHRSPAFQAVMDETVALIKELLDIPEGYSVLFLGGGASTQFMQIPANFLIKKAAYVNTGVWAKKALKEAKLFGEVIEVASSAADNYSYIPKNYDVPADVDYLHITTNNTIYGTEWQYVPETGRVPLACDMSSDILSRPVDVSKYGVIFAGAQKNMAPAGLTVAIVDRSLAGHELPITPVMYSYQRMIDKDSMYNTPPCWCIYMTGLVMDYLQNEVGGLEEMAKINHAKAKVLYDYLDGQDFYNNPVQAEYRSMMNVTFTSPNPDMDKKFCAAATEAGFVNLKGHRLVGGMRASIYNAMPAQGVNDLVDFMEKFRKENA